MSLVTKDDFSVKVTKLLQGFLSHALSVYLSVFDLVLTQSNDCVIKRMKPDSFVSHNFLKFSFTSSQGLWSNLLSVNVSLNQTLLNLFWPFFWERLSSFNPKRFCYSYAWSCSLCEGKTSFSIGPYLLKTLQILIYVVDWLYVIQCLLCSLSSSFYTVFDVISSNIDEILSINPSAKAKNMFGVTCSKK